MIRTLLLLTAFALGFASPSCAKDNLIKLGAEDLLVDPGDDYCRLNAAKGLFDKNLIGVQRRAHKGVNAFLALFAPCDDLERLRKAGSGTLSNWSMLLAPLNHGVLRKFPADTQKRTLDQMAKLLDRGIDMEIGDLNRRLNKALSDEAIATLSKIDLSKLKQLGLVHRTQNALYAAFLLNVSTKSYKKTILCVYSISFMQGYLVSYYVYREFKDRETAKFLLGRAIATTEAALRKNN